MAISTLLLTEILEMQGQIPPLEVAFWMTPSLTREFASVQQDLSHFRWKEALSLGLKRGLAPLSWGANFRVLSINPSLHL